MSERKGTKALELWCKRLVKDCPEAHIENMTTSWRNGIAFCALVHYFKPNLIPLSTLDPNDIYYNNQLAFSVAEKELGIPALLDPEDMVENEVPDRLSILTYLSQFYQRLGHTVSPKNVENESKDDPVTQISTPLSNESKNFVKFDLDKCTVCGQSVYLAQRLLVSHKLYHRRCFRCYKCSVQLSPGSYTEMTDCSNICCEACNNISSRSYDTNNDALMGMLEFNESLRTKSVSDKDTITNTLEEPNKNMTKFKTKPLSVLEKISLFEKNKRDSIEEKLDKLSLKENTIGDSSTLIEDSNSKIQDSNCLSEKDLSSTQIHETKINPDIICFESSDIKQPERLENTEIPVDLYKRDVNKFMFLQTQLSRLNKNENHTDSYNSSSDIVYNLNEYKPDLSENNTKNENATKQKDVIIVKNYDITTNMTNSTDEKNIVIKKCNNSTGESNSLIQNTINNANIGNLQNTTRCTDKMDFLIQIRNNDTDKSDLPIKNTNNIANESNIQMHNTNSNTDESNLPLQNTNNSDDIDNLQLQTTTKSTDENALEVQNRNNSINEINLQMKNTNISTDGNYIQIQNINNRTEENNLQIQKYVNNNSDEINLHESNEMAKNIINVPPRLKKTKKKEIKIEKAKVYPDHLNPFSDDEEDEVRNVVLPLRISTNPFGSSDEDEEIVPKNLTPIKRLITANPFWSDGEEPTSEEESSHSSRMYSKSSMTTSTPNISSVPSRKKGKAPAPPPPAIAILKAADDASCADDVASIASESSFNSTLNSEHKTPSKLTPRSRKKLAPTPPDSLSMYSSHDANNSLDKSGTVSLNSESGVSRRKGPAPGLPLPARREVRARLPDEQLQSQLELLDAQQLGLEKQGVLIEQMIRDKCEGDESRSVPQEEVEELVIQLCELVNEKNDLFRKHTELMYIRRQQRLEYEQADIEHEIRVIQSKPVVNRTDSDKCREEQLVCRLVETVRRRDQLVQQLEDERCRERLEDLAIATSIASRRAQRNSDSNTSSMKSFEEVPTPKKNKMKEKVKKQLKKAKQTLHIKKKDENKDKKEENKDKKDENRDKKDENKDKREENKEKHHEKDHKTKWF